MCIRDRRPGQGAALVRSAGNFAQLTSREGKYCVIKLPSGEDVYKRQVLRVLARLPPIRERVLA